MQNHFYKERWHRPDKKIIHHLLEGGEQTKSRHDYLVPILELLENRIRSPMFVSYTEKHAVFFVLQRIFFPIKVFLPAMIMCTLSMLEMAFSFSYQATMDFK